MQRNKRYLYKIMFFSIFMVVKETINIHLWQSNLSSWFGLVWFGLFWFYGILTVVGYLGPNTFLYLSSSASSSASSCHAISTDIPDRLSPHPYIVHCFRQIPWATSRIGTKLLYVGSNWTSCLCSKGSIGLHHSWARLYFSSSVLRVWFVKFW